MALIVKMEEGAKTPSLYTYDGKLFDFDELLRRANLEVQNYISQIRRGSKHQEELLTAYNNLLEGIKDGTITYDNGRYVDSKGRYSNSEGRKNKDWYGLMANHINTIQRGMNEYLKPEPKVEVTPTPASTPSSESKPREEIELPVILQEVPKQEELQSRPKTREELFTDWVATNHPRGNVLYSPSSLTVNDNILKDSDNFYNLIISGAPTLSLVSLLMLGVDEGLELKYDKKFYDINNNPTNISNNYFYKKILNQLYNNNQLKELVKGQAYYIPGTEKDETVLVWDKVNNSLGRMSMHDIPDYQYKYLQEYNEANNGTLGLPKSGYESYHNFFTQYLKNGGVLKAQNGIKFNTILEALNYYDDDLTSNKRLRNIVSDGILSYKSRDDSKATDINSPKNGFYDKELGGEDVEKSDLYKNWLNVLLNKENVARAWAERYRDLQPTNERHYKNWFNEDGSFNYELFKSGISGSRVYDDKVNGIGHDFYRGRVYKIDGEDGYYSNALDGYEVSTSPELSDDGLAYIYKMTKKAPSVETEQHPAVEEDPSNIYTTTPSHKLNLNYLNLLSELSPKLAGLNRIILSNRVNNKNSEIISESLYPNKKITPERYSSVTGDYAGKKALEEEGAKASFDGSIAKVSDYLQVAADLDRGELKNSDFRVKGNLLDNKEIARTREEALKRTEDNMMRRAETSNFNFSEINRIIRELGLLEASRRKNNWASWDNYLKKQESDLNTEYLKRKELVDNFKLQTASQQVDNEYNQALLDPSSKYALFAKSYSNTEVPISTTEEYKNYIRFKNSLDLWKLNKYNELVALIHRINYNNPNNLTPESIKKLYGYLKKGGSLKLIKRNKY